MNNYLKYTILLILLGTNTINAQLFINEVIPANKTVAADNFGEFDDIIELYNSGNSSINLAGYYISDNFSNPTKWQIPSTNSTLTTVAPGSYIIFWADNETDQGEHHLDFSLSSVGEQMILTAPDAITLIDSFSFSNTPNDLGYGRLPDASGNLSSLVPASPGATNNNSAPKAERPIVSPSSGKYTGPQAITISGETGSTFYYTVDGSLPTTSSTVYSGSFTIDTTQSIRAIAVKSGFENSFVTTSTYLIDFTSTLPIYHITMDPIDLWSDTAGIYATGTNGITGYCDVVTPRNWNQSWEKEAHLKIFMDDTLVVENNIGIKIGGNCKRKKPQKPLNILLRNQYSEVGTNEINYPLFKDNELDHFKRLYIRSGNNHIQELFTDITIARFVSDKFDIDGQSGQPSIIFLNGKYIGIQNVREKYDKWHYENDFPKSVDNRDSIDILKNPGRDFPSTTWWAFQRATYGDTMSWHNFIYDVATRDGSNNADYEIIKAQIDDNELLNYLITGHFCSAKDWVSNNQKVWKEKGSDKKWRWTMVDYDNSMKSANLTFNNLAGKILLNNYHGRNYYANILFRKLFDHPEFRGEYIQRMNTYMDLLFTNTIFDPIVDDYYNEILPDLPQANAIYGHTMTLYNNQVQQMKDFVAQRPPYVKQHMEAQWGLSGDFQLTLNFDAMTNGTVRLHSNYFEIPHDYSGVYYDNVPIEIHAVPNPGYRFSHWQETGDTNASLYETYTTNTTRTPIFVAALDLVINEIHYHPSDTLNEKEFIEIHNPGSAPRDLTNYEITSGFCFKFPEGTIIQPNEYIVLAKDASQFVGNGYQVFEWINSQLSNNGENIILQNPVNQTIDSVDYSDNLPWPLLADGFGKSLELDFPIPSNNELGSNWHASVAINGSPGEENSMPCQSTPPAIVINEINYNSNDQNNPGDWIELLNTSANAINISNWAFYDSENTFFIPAGTTLNAGEFLILAQDINLFSSIFPHLQSGNNLLGDFVFALSGSGERIAFIDQNQCVVDELQYNDKLPWDSIPDGNGPTLSLIDPNLDNLLPESWETSGNIGAPFGTPGRANVPCPSFSIATPNTICAGDTVLLHTTGNSNTNFTWSIQGGTPSSATGDSVYVLFQNPGLAIVELQYTYFECSDNTQQLLSIQTCNTAPVPQPDSYTVDEDNNLSSNVLDNDSDPESQPLIVSIVSGVVNGNLSINANGGFTYTPDTDYYGTDGFVYEVCDNGIPILCAQASVSIAINAVNDAPIAADDNFSTQEDTSVNGNLMTNDSDPVENTNLALTITPVTPPTNGTVVLSSNGNFIYTPNPNFNGTDVFTYEVCDNEPAGPTFTPDPNAIYYIDSPHHNKRLAATGSSEDAYTSSISATGEDVEWKFIDKGNGYWHVQRAAAGNLPRLRSDGTVNADMQVTANTGSYTYYEFNAGFSTGSYFMTLPSVPSTYSRLQIDNAGLVKFTDSTQNTGLESFTFTKVINLTAPACHQASVTITVASVNDQPLAINDIFIGDEDQSITGNVLTNDSDVDGNSMMATVGTAPSNGTLNLLGDGSFIYTPNSNYFGSDNFTYEVCDDGTPILCDTETVTLSVIPLNDAPITVTENYSINEDATLNGNVLTNDSDIENQLLSATIFTDVLNGSLTLNSNGSFTYIPTANYFGTDNFIYEVCDNGVPSLCATQLVNLTINSVNDSPTPMSDFFSANEDNQITDNVLTNDSDIDGNSLASTIQSQPTNGTLILQTSGNFTYTPTLNYFGSDSFTYEVCDNGSPSICLTETVNLSISPIDDAPITTADVLTIDEDNTGSGNVAANDLEVENQPMTVTLTSNVSNGMLTLLADGSFTYIPNSNYYGNDTFFYEICDNSSPARCTQETSTIIIQSVNDQPIVLNDSISTNESVQITGDASINDFDVETAQMSYTLVSFSPNGSTLFNFDGSFYYTPFAGFAGIDSFQYKACDNGSPNYCDTATVYIEVIPDCVALEISLNLEGAYDIQTSQMNTTLNTVRAVLPGMLGNPIAGQPYNRNPWNYNGTEGTGWTDTDYSATVVDWVLISLRTDVTKASQVHQLAGLVHADGTVSFLDECLAANELTDSYYVVAEHRNHMAVMSPIKVSVVNRTLSWDFRLANSYAVGGSGAKELSAGVWGLFAGDSNQVDDAVSYDINGKDKSDWLLDNGKFGIYTRTDMNMNGDVTGGDKALWLLNNGVFGSVKK